MQCYDLKMKVEETTEPLTMSANDIGNQGEQGLSAYEIAVQNGFIGTEQEWLDSLRYDHSEEFTRLAEQVKNDSRLSQQALEQITTLINGFDGKVNQANADLDTKVEGINTNLDTKTQGINNDLDTKINGANEVIDTKVNIATTQANRSQTEADRAKGYADTMQSVQAEVKQAHTGYFGKEYETLDERIDGDINDVLGKVNVMNYKGTSIVAENTLPRNLNVNGNKFEIRGKTEKLNLIKPSDCLIGYELAGNGNAVENKFWFVTNYIEVEPNTEYNWSGLNSNFVVEYDSNKNMIHTQTIPSPITTHSTTKYIRLNGKIEYLEHSKVYTNDLYTDNQVTLVEHGKNFFDFSKMLSAFPSDKISGNAQESTLKNGVNNVVDFNLPKGQLTLSGYISSTSFNGEIKIIYNDGTTKLLFGQYNNQPVKRTPINLTTSADKNVVGIKFTIYGSNNFTLSNFQIEQGSVATDYEPYQGNRVVFDTPLRSLKTDFLSIEDNILINKQKWGLNNLIGITTFNGSENWELWRGFPENDFIGFILRTDFKYGLTQRGVECDLLNGNSGYLTHRESIGLRTVGDFYQIYVSIKKDKLSTPNVEGFKQWLQKTPMTIQYELETPIIKPITPIEGNEVFSYNDTTYITTENKAQPTLDCDIPTNLQAQVQTTMAENRSLKAQNVALSKEVEQTKANQDYMSMMTGVEL